MPLPSPLDEATRLELELALDGRSPWPGSFLGRDRAALERAARAAAPDAAPATPEDALVRLYGRPSMRVQSGRIVPPESDAWRRRLAIFRPLVEPALRSVARVSLAHHDDLAWAGTAWMIAKNIAITTREVAQVFAVPFEGGYRARTSHASGEPVEARLDFTDDPAPSADGGALVTRVRFMSLPDDAQPDLALLDVEGDDLPDPIELGDDPAPGDWLGVAGYVARDDRRGDGVLAGLLDGASGAKRVAPGELLRPRAAAPFVLAHDASLLGAGAGAVLLALGSGKAAGLCFAGCFLRPGLAVKASTLREILAAQGIRPPAPRASRQETTRSLDKETRLSDGTHKPAFFRDRKGYEPEFLGADFPVPWPDMSRWKADLVPLEHPGKGDPHRLDYTHFSVVLSKSRRVALVTAVNIDGKRSKSIDRIRDRWYFDGRVGRVHQMGNDVYAHNHLDRGHMVRREDPNWGTAREAERANGDTFHYTNAAPQHALLNQRTWRLMEQWILDTAKTRDLKATVFTGPVLRKRDFPYGEVRIPSEFYKVIVVVDDVTGALEATGYLQSQVDYLGDGIDERAFDGGSTYQVPIRHLERITKLGFGKALRRADPMEKRRTRGIETGAFPGHRVREPSDIRRSGQH